MVKKHLRTIVLLTGIALLFSPFLSNQSFAGNAPSNANVMSIQVNNPIASEDLLALIETIVNYLLWIAVVMAPLACIVGALMFLTAGGNDKKVSTAKKMITWAIVGLTIALVSKGIVTLIQNFLESTR